MTESLDQNISFSNLEQRAFLGDINEVNGVLSAIGFYKREAGNIDQSAAIELDHLVSLGAARLILLQAVNTRIKTTMSGAIKEQGEEYGAE